MIRRVRVAFLASVACLTPGQDTKISNITFPGHVHDHKLMAVGVRTMSFLRFPLYSVGLYSNLQAGDRFGQQDWCIRIVPIRNVNLNHLRGAYGRRLPNDLEGRDDFLASFPNTSMPMERSYLLIEWRGGELTVSRHVDGEVQEAPPIRSAALAQAILDIYLGDNAAISDLKVDLADSMQKL